MLSTVAAVLLFCALVGGFAGFAGAAFGGLRRGRAGRRWCAMGRATVAGVPARVVAQSCAGTPALDMDQRV